MKTFRITLVLFSFIFFAGEYVYPAKPMQGNNSQAPVMRHQVNIYPVRELATCNDFLVQLTDGNGNLVAPALPYKPGQNSYTFYERGPASGKRIATLVMVKVNGVYVCDVIVLCMPDIKTGPFYNGRTYVYNLYPRTQINE